jgi:hypothetical protein
MQVINRTGSGARENISCLDRLQFDDKDRKPLLIQEETGVLYRTLGRYDYMNVVIK